MTFQSHFVPMRGLVVTMLLLSLMSMTGCFILPLEPKDKGLATDQYRIEMEFLPQALMVKEDTSPKWDLGRKAFVTGEDRILVLGRTTSYADKDEEGEPIAGTMRDRKLERVWITIRPDVPLGKALKLEDLETVFLTGYDVNNLDTKGFFSGPALMKGYVNLVEEGPDKVVVIFDLEVRPNRPFQAENWFVEGKYTIPVVPEGRIATRAVSRDLQVTEQPAPVEPVGPTVDATAPLTTPLTAPSITPDGKVDSTGTTQITQTDPVPTEAVKEKSIVGKWAYNTPGMDFRFQFGENGKFIYSSTRGDGVNDTYDPGLVYGTWEIKQSKTSSWVVLLVDRCEFASVNVMNDFHPTDKTITLKLEWQDDKPVLTGEIPMARAKKPMKYICESADYPDMNKVFPPAGRRRNSTPVANPHPYW